MIEYWFSTCSVMPAFASASFEKQQNILLFCEPILQVTVMHRRLTGWKLHHTVAMQPQKNSACVCIKHVSIYLRLYHMSGGTFTVHTVKTADHQKSVH